MSGRASATPAETDGLSAVFVAQQQAVFAYGVLGARVGPEEKAFARSCFDARRAWRDRTAAALRDRGIARPATAASYDVTVTNRAAAVALAVRVEEGLGQRLRDLVVSAVDPGLRELAVEGLRDAAVRATAWRLVGGIHPASVALPGS